MPMRRKPTAEDDKRLARTERVARGALTAQPESRLEKQFVGTKTLKYMVSGALRQRQRSLSKQDYENAQKARRLNATEAKRRK